MKILVCRNKHCQHNQSEDILKALMEYVEEVEFTYSTCMDLCDYGPNIMTFPDTVMYGKVTVDRIEDIIKGDVSDLKHPQERLYTTEMDVFLSNPTHRRTVKLFRYQLEKTGDTNWRSVRDAIILFREKYEVNGMDFTSPIKMALIGTTKGPGIPKIVQYLGKDETFRRIDKYLADNKYRL